MKNSHSTLKSLLLRGYRLSVIIMVVLILRDHHLILKRRTDHPVTVKEVQEFIPDTNQIKEDFSDREGWYAYDKLGKTIGYAVRTSPTSDFLIGYCGSTDTLVVFDLNDNVLGFQIRASGDTTRHVKDVKENEYFMTILNNMSWDKIAHLDLKEEEIDGVSGATLTSVTTIEAISYRLRHSLDKATFSPTIQWQKEDWLLSLIIIGSILFTFSNWRRLKSVRLAFHLIIFVYLGFIYGNMISIGLVFGWSAAGIPWHLSSGLVLLVMTSIIVPWSTRRPMYCTQICPHGLAQQWLGNLPIKKRTISKQWDKSLRIIPALLIGYALLIQLLEIPVELAELEAFNAYTISLSGWFSISLATLGLIASLFYRQPYCHYGCPTGAVLNFVRSHGQADHFQKKDWFALALFCWAIFLYWNSGQFTSWIYH